MIGATRALNRIIPSFQSLSGPNPSKGKNGGQNNTTLMSSQVWKLTNDAVHVAKAMVTPFTYSGTFSETCDSAGWWV